MTRYTFLPLLLLQLILLLIFPIKTALSKYDYILGQKITLDDVEPPDNYDLQVFLEEDEAINTIFKNCDEIFVDKLTLAPQEKKELEDKLKRELRENSFNVFIGKKQHKVEKYAIITDENGCFHPITFIISVGKDGKVDSVAIMVYRESRGKEVTRTRFLHQYKGKSVDAPIRLNKDIIHITGATTSVRGINRGVRKTLAILDKFYFNNSDKSYPQSKYGKEISSNIESLLLFSHAYFALDDIIEVLISGTTELAASKAFNNLANKVKRLDKIFNKSYKNSELNLINKKAGKKPVKCSSELLNVIKASLHYSEITKGDFDITEGSLIDILQKNRKKPLKPEHVEKLIGSATYKNITIGSEKNNNNILFKERNTTIDTTIISKGFIVDKLIESLEKDAISNALVNFGGNIRTIGNPSDDTNWKIAIPDPQEHEKSIGYVEITNKAVSVSGNYGKTIIKNRLELSKLYGEKTKNFFKTNILDSIILAPTAFESNSIAAITILSKLNNNMQYVNKINGIEGICIYKGDFGNSQITTSNNVKDYFVPVVEPISVDRTKPSCAL